MTYPVGIPGVVPAPGNRPIIFHTTGATFAPIVNVASGASVEWRFGDGSRSSLATPGTVNYGSAGNRIALLSVSPRSALRVVNVGYNHLNDQGTAMPDTPDLAGQGVTAIDNLDDLTGLQILTITGNPITRLAARRCTSLQFVESYYNQQLVNVDLTGSNSIIRVCFEMNPLVEFRGLSGMTLMRDFRSRGCQMATYDFGSNPLTYMEHFCAGSTATLTSFGLEGRPLPAMSQFWIFGSPNVGGILRIPGATGLSDVRAASCGFTAADFSANPNLRSYIDLRLNQFPQPAIDDVLLQLVNRGQTNGQLYMGGMAAPSAQGQTYVDTLRARTWTVSFAIEP